MHTSINLAELQEVQAVFDSENFSGAETAEGKRIHVALHLGKLMGKYAGIEEQADHGAVDDSILRTEVAPDLLVYAAQLSELTNGKLGRDYNEHVHGVQRGMYMRIFDVNGTADLQKWHDQNHYERHALDTYEQKRRGVYFGLHEPIASLVGGEVPRLVRKQISPKLVTAAFRISNLMDFDIGEAYVSRLHTVAERNGTGKESVERALKAAGNTILA